MSSSPRIRDARRLVDAAAVLVGVAWAAGCGDGTTEPPPAPPPPPPPAQPTAVSVSPSTAELTALGSTVQLSAEVRDQNGNVMTGAAVSWSSSDASVASTDAGGLVTAAANGTATITATAGSASGSASVTVAQSVSAVAVSPAADTLVALGDTLRLTAEASDANGQTVAGAEIMWASDDATVATVDASGLVTAAGDGMATITAASGSVSGSAAVTVARAVGAVAVSPAADTLVALGDTVRLAAEALDANGHAVAGAEFAWSSSDDVVATVDASGLVTAVGNGMATITAASGSVSGGAEVTVAQAAHSVLVSPALDTIALGDTVRLLAEAYDHNGHTITDAQFEWSSSDASVATVDDSGLVWGRAEGTVTITAASGDVRGSAEIVVENPDRAALVALYEATDGPNWVNNENWLTDAPLREWYGVRTDGDGRVVGVNLSGVFEALRRVSHGLSGRLPPEIGNLGRLDYLYLSRNDLTGPIPAELGNLANLTWLSLFDNDLTGPIPPEIGNLRRLTNLDLSANSLTGPIPPEIGNLERLEELYLSGNSLTGPIPPEIGNLASLEGLIIAQSGLTGPIPREIGNLGRLERLNLESNALTGSVPPEIGRLASLILLTLANNALTGQLPSSFLDSSLLFFWWYNNAGLCAPDTAAFRAWLRGLEGSRPGPFCSSGSDGVPFLEPTFVPPVRPGWESNLKGITLAGPGGSVELDDESNRPMAILRDPRNGQVRGFLRDLPPAILTRADAAAAVSPEP